MKKIIRVIGIILGIVILIPVAVFVWLRVTMYTPADKEPVEFTSGSRTVSTGDRLDILTFNIGYAGYNKSEDFFMDGGKGVLPESVDVVMENLSGIASIINAENCDMVLVQEADVDSRRSYHTNEVAYLGSSIGMPHSFAYNFRVRFVPFPVPPTGSVNSGVVTYTDLKVAEATRLSLPEAAPWYMSIAYMKRCLLVDRIPLENSDKELVIINHHLEAYTDEAKRDKQTEVLTGLMEDEYARGNYVIVGGDFNQEFEGNNNPPIISETGWIPGTVLKSEIPEGFVFAVADNAPSCRSLEEPFTDNETSQVYIIDGFIVSDNIVAESVEVLDRGFEYSDHNPVKMTVRLK